MMSNIRKALILLSLMIVNGCTIISFDKGLNYEKTSEYSFNYDKGTQGTTIRNKRNGKYISISLGQNSCGSYGLFGPLIFPVIPIWQNYDCKDFVIGASQTYKIHIFYRNKIYEPIKISYNGGFYFPLQTKSINDTAILVVEKKDGEIFEIPFRYQHTFSFDLFPGR